MAGSKKPQLVQIRTGKGIAVYPKLAEPDEYKGKAKYKTGVKRPRAEVEKLIAQITAAAEAMVEQTKAEMTEKLKGLKGAALVKQKEKIAAIKLHLPFKAEVDDAGNETDNVIFHVSMNASYKNAQGVEVPLKPKLFDAFRQPITKKLDLWGGSIINVAAGILPVYVEASGSCGVSLRMVGVQVIELKQGGATAESMGFEDEDGFSAEELSGSDTESTTKPAAGDEPSGEDEQF